MDTAVVRLAGTVLGSAARTGVRPTTITRAVGGANDDITELFESSLAAAGHEPTLAWGVHVDYAVRPSLSIAGEHGAMFDSVLQQRKPERRLGTGAVLSVLGHGVLFGALFFTSKDRVEQAAEGVAVTFFAQAPRPAAPGPPALAAAPPAEKREAAAARRMATRAVKSNPAASRVTEEKEASSIPEAEEVPKTDAAGAIGTRSGSQPSGGEGLVGQSSGPSGGSSQGVPGGKATTTSARSSRQVLPFGPGMTRPRLLSGPEIKYTPQALAAKVSGMAILKCVITMAGTIQGCRTIKGLPHMERALLDAMAGRRYTPVMYQGHAVSVDYVFNIKLVLPGG